MNNPSNYSPDQPDETRLKSRYARWTTWIFYSLRTKFVITLLAVALIPLAILAYFDNQFIRNEQIATANQSLLAAASQTANSLDNFIQSTQNEVRTEAKLPDFVDRLELVGNAEGEDRFRSIQQRLILTNLRNKDASHIISYGLLDKNGMNVSDSLGVYINKSEAHQDYFKKPIETGATYVSPVLFSTDNEEAVIYFSAPVYNVFGTIQGVLRAEYKAAVLQNLLEENTKGAAGDSFAVLFDENLLHLAHSNPDLSVNTNYRLVNLPADLNQITALQAAGRLPQKPVTELSTALPELAQNLADLKPEAPFFEAIETTARGGQEVNQVAVAELDEQPGWRLAFFIPQQVLLEPAIAQTNRSLLLSVGIGIVVAVVAAVVSQQLTRPIVHLTDVAQQVARGDLSVQAPIESNDEIGQLSHMFNSMTDQLRNVFGLLEEQVRERTSELALSIEVGQQAAAIRELDILLPAITEFIRDRFDLYYVHVYFVDNLGQNLIIKSGTGTVGQTLMRRKHSLPVGGNSIVGQVAVTAQSIVVSNTETSPIHQPNPLLPYTRSELAVPLIVSKKVIGVLDMQSDRENTFRDDNLTVFEAMGTQLALSIDGAQQWALAQEAQRKSENALRQLTRERWAETLQTRRQALAFAYDLSGITPIETATNDNGHQELSVPVVIQNQAIGHLSVDKPVGRDWSEDEKSLLEAVAQQLAQKAENLRLFDDTEQRATREQITRQITDKIRSSRDIETALRTAAAELSKALGTPKAVVNLRMNEPDKAGDE